MKMKNGNTLNNSGYRKAASLHIPGSIVNYVTGVGGCSQRIGSLKYEEYYRI